MAWVIAIIKNKITIKELNRYLKNKYNSMLNLKNIKFVIYSKVSLSYNFMV